VVDTNNSPVEGIQTFISLTSCSDEFIQTLTTDYYGSAYFSIPLPTDTTTYIIKVKDFCGNVKDTAVVFDFTKFDYNANFMVECAERRRIFASGYVYTLPDTTPLVGARVYGFLLKDPQHPVVTVTDENGYYEIEGDAPYDGDTIVLKVIDACENVDSTLVVYSADSTEYHINFYSNVLSCSDTTALPYILITGRVTLPDSTPVEGQIIEADVLPNYFIQEEIEPAFAITNEDGYYSLKVNYSHGLSDSVFVSLVDGCDSLYTKVINFDFTEFRFNINFTINCAPEYSEEPPHLSIGMEEDWNQFNTYTFYAHLFNAYNTLYFIWYLGDDTVVTNDPTLTYEFPAIDTCLDVYVQVILENNIRMTSDTVTVCIYDPFDEFGEDCYADFVSTSLDTNNLQFAFIPFIAYREGLVPQQARWDFGDGSYLNVTDSVDKVVVHTYDRPGEYNVTYTVTFVNDQNNECVAEWSDPVWAGTQVWYPDSCAALFYVEVDSEDVLTLHFQDISYPGDYSSIEYYYWDFGDGESSTASSPIHTYPAEDTFQVSLEILTSSGCYDDFITNVAVGGELYTILFYPDTLGYNAKAGGYGVKFYNISKTNSDKWTWDFGEETKSSIVKVSIDTVIHYYSDTGYYTVTLTEGYTGASFSMTIHVTDSMQVVPVYATLTPGTITNVPQVQQTIKILNVYPNPAHNTISVLLPEVAKSAQIEVYNISGQLIAKYLAANSDKATINVKYLPSGTYFIKVVYDGKQGLARFIKQ
jgi:PKD repeat protein